MAVADVPGSFHVTRQASLTPAAGTRLVVERHLVSARRPSTMSHETYLGGDADIYAILPGALS